LSTESAVADIGRLIARIIPNLHISL
jgi:hypothetical protein